MTTKESKPMNKKIICFLCGGEGWLAVTSTNRINPKWVSLKRCPICEGKGYLRRKSDENYLGK